MTNGPVGTVVYTGEGGYQEIIEAISPGVCLIECADLASQYPMYRLEYQDARGYDQQETYFDWYSASANFERRSTGA